MTVSVLCVSDAAGETTGGSAGDAARMAAYRERVGTIVATTDPDRPVLEKGEAAGTDVLARSPVVRALLSITHDIRSVAGPAPRSVSAFDAAVADAAVEAALRGPAPAQLAVGAGSAIAYHLAQDARFGAFAGVPDGMAAELLRSLDPPMALKGERGGVAVVMPAAGTAEGGAEAIGVAARSAAHAVLCAQGIAAAVPVVTSELSAEAVWDALSEGARIASALKAAGHLRGAVLTLRGRGRAIGPLDGDRLLRFGVSDWR